MYQPWSNSFMPQYQVPFNQLIKVNGLESAKAYPTSPNSTVALFDSNEDIMYIKSTDANNFTNIRRFKFEEIVENSEKNEKYVTLDEFYAFKEEILNGKQLIRPAGKSKQANE